MAFQEKPKELSRHFCSPDGKVNASMGVYVFKTTALIAELEEGPGLGRKFDFGRDIIPEMISRWKVYVYPFKQGAGGHKAYWRDVGTLDSYFQANMDLLGNQPAFDVHNPSWPIFHAQIQAGPAIVGPSVSASVQNSIVAPGCRIEGEVRESVLFPGVVIEEGATIERSILMDGVYVEKNSVVRNAILDKFVRVRRGSFLGVASEPFGESKAIYTPKGVVVVPKNEVIGPERKLQQVTSENSRRVSKVLAATSSKLSDMN